MSFADILRARAWNGLTQPVHMMFALPTLALTSTCTSDLPQSCWEERFSCSSIVAFTVGLGSWVVLFVVTARVFPGAAAPTLDTSRASLSVCFRRCRMRDGLVSGLVRSLAQPKAD